MSEIAHMEAQECMGNLTPPQMQAVKLLLDGKKVREIAQEMNYSCRAVYSWLAKPEVKAILRSYRSGQLIALVTAAQSSAESAMQLLVETVEDVNGPLALRLRAAERLLSTSTQLNSLMDDGERIDQLEAMVNELLAKIRVY
jgi:hypothetical protein